MDWIKIGSALFLGAMLVYLFPQMRRAIKHAPKGSNSDWMGFLMVIVVVALFITFLIMMV